MNWNAGPLRWRKNAVAGDVRVVLLLGFLCWPVGAANGQAEQQSFGRQVSAAAIERTTHQVRYDPGYVSIGYPGGDVPADSGVCTDVVIRALRTLDIDLQVAVHDDMTANFSAYPSHWGLSRPDPNIDHRRVPNLETLFARLGAKLAPSDDLSAYQPGDIVAWNLRGAGGYLAHIGIVTDKIGSSGAPLVVHNIGDGPKLEDILFAWPMTGRYRLTADMFAH